MIQDRDIYDRPGTWLAMTILTFLGTLVIILSLSTDSDGPTYEGIAGAVLCGIGCLYAMAKWAEARRG